jgi:hypothetical protein
MIKGDYSLTETEREREREREGRNIELISSGNKFTN